MTHPPRHDPDRPDPEDLLDRYSLRDTASPTLPSDDESDDTVADYQGPRRRGRLRIYLGMAPGVGKTYAMLNEGHRRKQRGTDVVIGFVETHKRPVTAQQIGDLEVIPRKQISYRGIALEEMDLDGVLARHPHVALVDELAHTNVEGSLHAKRYEDVEALLAAGITVIATVNIQHLESLNDIVYTITGVRQRETIPDHVLNNADEVELLDIAPDALRSRIRHGNVYPPERVTAALENYFTLPNLTALRELALQNTARKTENQLESLMRGRPDRSAWQVTGTERIMVAYDSRPTSLALIRAGARLASSLRVPLIAVTVLQLGLGRSNSEDLAAATQLAGDLGAEVHQISARDVAAALAEVARTQHVTQIVIGQPLRTRWQELFGGSIVNRLLRMPLGIAIHVVPHISTGDEKR